MTCGPRISRAIRIAAILLCLAGWAAPLGVEAEVQVAPGFRVEVVATRIPRPIQLAWDGAGNLVVLSHGWRGDSAAEVFRFDPRGPLPVDGSRMPRVLVPFADEPRKNAFGSLAVDPRNGDLILGEENGNRIYRLTADERLRPLAVGLNHLVGGSGLTFDRQGRLVILDFASPEGQLRSETPPPPALQSLGLDDYHGPLVFRVDPAEDRSFPRRLDLVAPLFPKGWTQGTPREPLARFISVAPLPGDELAILTSLGEVLSLGPARDLRRLARLPAGHYHRTNMTVAADGSVLVSTGFHIRQLVRLSPDGAVTTIARELGDPGGLVVDNAGAVYLAEMTFHRIIRISPTR